MLGGRWSLQWWHVFSLELQASLYLTSPHTFEFRYALHYYFILVSLARGHLTATMVGDWGASVSIRNLLGICLCLYVHRYVRC